MLQNISSLEFLPEDPRTIAAPQKNVLFVRIQEPLYKYFDLSIFDFYTTQSPCIDIKMKLTPVILQWLKNGTLLILFSLLVIFNLALQPCSLQPLYNQLEIFTTLNSGLF